MSTNIEFEGKVLEINEKDILKNLASKRLNILVNTYKEDMFSTLFHLMRTDGLGSEAMGRMLRWQSKK